MNAKIPSAHELFLIFMKKKISVRIYLTFGFLFFREGGGSHGWLKYFLLKILERYFLPKILKKYFLPKYL
jgi:hypothetical protein